MITDRPDDWWGKREENEYCEAWLAANPQGMLVETVSKGPACGVPVFQDNARQQTFTSKLRTQQTSAPAKPVYSNANTMEGKQTKEVLISKITMCQSPEERKENIIQVKRNPFQWRFWLA